MRGLVGGEFGQRSGAWDELGAVDEERSPLKDATDYHVCQQIPDLMDRGEGIEREYTIKNDDQEPLFWETTPVPSSLEDDNMMRETDRREDVTS